jgi:hypothetical protein
MDLVRDLRIDENGITGEVFFRLFDRYILLVIEDSNPDYAKKCAAHLNDLSETLISRLCEASLEYCNAALKANGQPLRKIKAARDILMDISPAMMIVPACPESSIEPIIHLELNCSWEQEHGMEWIVRGDRVLYVGAFVGEDPFSFKV